MNRRGSAQDIILFGILMFAFGTAILVGYYASNQIYDGLLNNSQVQASNATVEVLQASKAVTPKLDYWVLAAFIGFMLALVITAWFVSANPLFIGVYIIVLILAVIFSMVLSNAWETISQRAVFVSSLSVLVFTNHILLYLPYYTAVAGMVGMIVLFAKPAFSAGGDL